MIYILMVFLSIRFFANGEQLSAREAGLCHSRNLTSTAHPPSFSQSKQMGGINALRAGSFWTPQQALPFAC